MFILLGNIQSLSTMSIVLQSSLLLSPHLPYRKRSCKVRCIKQVVSIPQLVNECSNVEEILHVAVNILKCPGEESLHWEQQLVHKRKRQRGSSNAVKRLQKFLVGCSAATTNQREHVIHSDGFLRLLTCACSELEPCNDDDLRAYSETVKSAAVLLSSSGHTPRPQLTAVLADAVSRLDKSYDSKIFTSEELDALYWALHRLHLLTHAPSVATAHKELALPFSIYPLMLKGEITIKEVVDQVPFTQSILVTKDKKRVAERRKTCWVADTGVSGLAYSGKIMTPVPFPPCIARVRDLIEERTGIYYDCCLINLYDDGVCACAYHVDPDLGSIFSRDTVVASVGETRRFNLRRIVSTPSSAEVEPHVYHVHDGDVFYMTRDCQEAFQHAVLKSEGPQNDSPRVSIVFKKTIPYGSGKRGHGIPGAGTRRDSGAKPSLPAKRKV